MNGCWLHWKEAFFEIMNACNQKGYYTFSTLDDYYSTIRMTLRIHRAPLTSVLEIE